MSGLEIVLAVVIALGVVGVVVPLVPGDWLVLLAILVWAVDRGSVLAWVVLAVAAALVVTGAIVKYAVPGRRLKLAGVPGSTLVVGGAAAVVGFFVVPVVGLVLGFLVGIYLAEWRRLRDRRAAWPATVHAVKAVGLGILIELTFALLAALTWVIGVVLT
ncbi:DUF456 domain-containing protein [Nocardioides terrisoli]|uniref:DUF456 domain-containing protein n=1 Tax=Nocardioides terrisoli TaxID=3388267 RepID=UPI00287B9531|nr:DUF456 domain-containing protein [Nocardioides marmorisolisilvae]